MQDGSEHTFYSTVFYNMATLMYV